MTQQVYIVRHGNTFDKGDTVTRVGARTDLPLSDSGQAQAQSLAEHFASLPITFGHVLCSPLRRTRQTADAILAAQPSAPSPEISEFLREIDYGPDENQPEQAVVDRIGQAALEAWEKAAIPPPGWKVEPEALVASWRRLFEDAARAPGNDPLLVVTSNGIARFALLALQQKDRPAAELKLKTGAYGILDLDTSGKARLRDWNLRP